MISRICEGIAAENGASPLGEMVSSFEPNKTGVFLPLKRTSTFSLHQETVWVFFRGQTQNNKRGTLCWLCCPFSPIWGDVRLSAGLLRRKNKSQDCIIFISVIKKKKNRSGYADRRKSESINQMPSFLPFMLFFCVPFSAVLYCFGLLWQIFAFCLHFAKPVFQWLHGSWFFFYLTQKLCACQWILENECH